MSLGKLYDEYKPRQKTPFGAYHHQSHHQHHQPSNTNIPFTIDIQTGQLNMDLTGLPFWIWDESSHQRTYILKNGECCFNHLIGLPVKAGRELPMFPYELEVWRSLFDQGYENPNNDYRRYRHVWIKKAAGMGITEFIIRVMLYLPLAYPKDFNETQMVIMTGIRMNTARDIMDRLKALLMRKLRINMFNTNEKELRVNGCIIQAYPAKTPYSIHGLPNPVFFFMDEFDFFPESIHNDVIAAVERYFAKSNPYVVLNSTPYRPDGLLERIEKQSEEECLYKRLFLLWEKGLGYIYSTQDIELARLSDSWAREYEGQYRGLKGNLFPQNLLDYASYMSDILEIIQPNTQQVLRQIQRSAGELSLLDIQEDYRYLGSGYTTSMGIDPAYNSSNFAFVVTKQIGDLIYVIHERELQAPSHEEAIEITKSLVFDDYPTYHPKLYIDGSGVSFIRTLKKEIMDQAMDYHNMDQQSLLSSITATNGMMACPISFSKFGDRMNYHLKRLFELGLIRVSPDITPGVYTALQTASYDENKQKFDKKNTAKNDCYDALRLACINYKIAGMGVLY